MWATVKRWYSQPFNAEMDAPGWFFFFGLLIVISILWGIILKHIKAE